MSDALNYMNTFCQWPNPPEPDERWERAIAKACVEISARDKTIEQLRESQGYFEFDGMKFNVKGILHCVVRNAVNKRTHKRTSKAWAAVADVCGLGSTSATKLCRAVGIDPDTGAANPGGPPE
jgi:hypothetical protein